MANRDVYVYQDTADVIERLAKTLQIVSNEVLSERDIFLIGISGGSMIHFLSKALPKITTTFHKWIIFFNDERLVPEDSEESTFGACKKALIEVVDGLTEDRFVPVNYNLSEPAEVAKDYAAKLSNYCRPQQLPKFDIVLLGLGEDGHTCSLFPGHPLLKEEDVLVGVVTDSPKPPPNRVTLTLPVLKNAANVVFVATGEGKAIAVKGVLDDNDKTLPATLVKLNDGKLTWILDKAAARLLQPGLYK